MTDSAPRSSAWFIGEGTLLIRCAEVYRAAGHDIVGVASSDPAVRRWADAQRVQVVAADDALASQLAARPFDYLFSVVNLVKLGRDVIGAPRVLAVNFHDGPLPRYAGLNAPVWALINGATSYGVTWHEMTDRVDAGRILKQQLFDIPDRETAFGLNARCYEAGLASFTSLVEDLTNHSVVALVQPPEERVVFARDQRPDTCGVIDWSRPAADLDREILAMDFGPYPNVFGVCRVLTRAGAYVVTTAQSDQARGQVGVVESADASGIVVGTGAGRLQITGVRRATGEQLSLPEFIVEAGVRSGFPLAPPDSAQPTSETLRLAVRAEGQWLARLRSLETLPIPYAKEASSTPGSRAHLRGPIPGSLAGLTAPEIATSVAAFLTRLAGRTQAVLPLAVAPPPTVGLPVLSDRVPVLVDLSKPWSELRRACASASDDAATRGSFFSDLVLRHPDLSNLRHFARWRNDIVLDPAGHAVNADATLAIRPNTDARVIEWDAAAAALPQDVLARLHGQWMAFATQATETDAPLARVALLDASERTRLLDTWNETAVEHDVACIHELVERQVRRTPQATALISFGVPVTYLDLDERSNRLARYLQSLGTGPETLVGICLDRSVSLVVSLLAVLKAGAAYVPLDPDYPADRLRLVADDAGITTVIAEERLVDRFPQCEHVVSLSRVRAAVDALPDGPLGATARPDNLAYVIYTSGSTGKPKGVMLEHRHVANFFAGMDACVPRDAPGVWLAVTSISFDISVLELFWTLARGFSVVLYAGASAVNRPVTASTRPEPIDLSLFYFSADEGQDERQKYRLLIEGAKFADTHGFAAVWTPERHFHAFGGLYPNPAVTGAAVAAVTSRVGIRAGSCVLPLHHPLRVAEEWSVVDNISAGRVGIAFASGWQPNDFVLRPESYADRKRVLLEGIETVKALWRGEAVTFMTPRGIEQAIRTLPRPVQPNLPVWITAAGNPETFAAAAAAGAGVLTHLLGQTVEELATKVAAYRSAWKAAGHEGNGHLVLMLHTLVAEDDDFVRRVVRQPLMDYLRTSIDLVKPFAESFPTFAARAGGQNPSEIFASLSEDDYDALVEHSFERYYETSGLFGRPETCLAMIDRLKALGVDEVACLVDFGVDTDTVLTNLPHLHTLLQRANEISPTHDESIAALAARYNVTHLQCTPSMARMLLLDSDTRQTLGRLRAMFVGGEALPASLASELCEAMPSGELWNMYGPTETTVWSTVERMVPPIDSVSIGRPIANTRIYILDGEMQPVPVGLPGDLYIGGEGVARGYWHRPELTAERFLPDPFVSDAKARIYATGDVARYRDDGAIEFLGRSDQQVKIRGHRIELGEIEAALLALPQVSEAVVVAREDHAGDKRLVAYVITHAGATADGSAIRSALAIGMPDFLVPSHVVFLESFPLTPNNKIDRLALPAVDDVAAPARALTAPASEMERTVVEVWREVLRTEGIGTDDNFFDIGGDSLLAAQVLSLLRQQLTQPVSLTDLFRFPTVRALGEHLSGSRDSAALTQSIDRGRSRQDARRQHSQTAQARRLAARSKPPA